MPFHIATVAVLVTGCVMAEQVRAPASIECRLAKGTILVRDDIGRVAASANAGRLEEAVALARQTSRDGHALLDVVDEIQPQNDLAREFGWFGQFAATYEFMDGPEALLDREILSGSAASSDRIARDLLALLPPASLEGCLP